MGGREPTWKALRLEGDTTQYNIAANDSNDGCEDAGERLLFIRQAVGKQTADHPPTTPPPMKSATMSVAAMMPGNVTVAA
jgi:hypothetical protein